MNASAAVSILLGLANLTAATLVLASAPRRTLHRVGALAGLGMTGWSVGWLLLSGESAMPAAGIAGRFAWIAVAFLPVAWFHYLCLSLERPPRRRFAPGYAAAGIVAAVALTPVFSLLAHPFVSASRERLAAFIPLSGLGLLALVCCSFPTLVRSLRAEETESRNRARVMALVGLFLALVGLHDLLLLIGSAHPSPIAMRARIGSGPNAENSGLTTARCLSAPITAAYSSGVRSISTKTRSPARTPSVARTLAKRLLSSASCA